MINAARIFCLTSGPTRSWRFFSFKAPSDQSLLGLPKPHFQRLAVTAARGLSLSRCAHIHTHRDTHTQTDRQTDTLTLTLTHTHTLSHKLTHTLSLSLTHTHTHTLSLSLCSIQRAAERNSSFSKQILCCFSYLTCKYSRNHSTGIIIIWRIAHLISSDALGRKSWLISPNGSRFSHYLKICNLRVQINLNIEKIIFKVVQIKFLAMHIINEN